MMPSLESEKRVANLKESMISCTPQSLTSFLVPYSTSQFRLCQLLPIVSAGPAMADYRDDRRGPRRGCGGGFNNRKRRYRGNETPSHHTDLN